jgi:hypothetical protein
MDIYINKNKDVNSETIVETKTLRLFSKDKYSSYKNNKGESLFFWGKIYSLDNCPLNSLQDLFLSIKERGVEQTIQATDGNFVCLYCTGTKSFIFADQYNRKEVFYMLEDNQGVISLSLGNVVKGIKTIEYNQEALGNLLGVYGYYAPKKHTIYKGIKRLGVGEYFSIENNTILLKQNVFRPKPSMKYSEKELNEYSDLMIEAVRKRSSKICNWILLSSGWDSTAILAILVKLYGRKKVKCVIGKMCYSKRSGTINQFEIDKAQKIADYYGVELFTVSFDFTSDHMLEYWERMSPKLKEKHLYSFSSHNFSVLTDFIAEKGGLDYPIFAGEFSDGAHNFGFSQYATFLQHSDIGFREYNDKMASYLYSPSFFEKVINNEYKADYVYKLFKERYGNALFDDEIELSLKERIFKYFASFFLRRSRIPFYGMYNSKICTNGGCELLENELGEEYLSAAVDSATPEDLYSWILYLYNSFHWQGSTVRCFDVGTNIYNPIAFPFSDVQILNYLSQMPEGFGRGLELKPTKYPLKWMLQNKIDYPLELQEGPHSYLYDVNPEFNHVNEILFESKLSIKLKEALAGYPYEQILNEKYFDLSYLRKIVSSYLSGKVLVGQERSDLSAIASLCLIGWYK